MRKSIAAILCLAICAYAPTAQARYEDSQSGWIIVGDEESCGMGSDFEGPGNTFLTFHKYLDGKTGLTVSNANWSAKKDTIYPISYVLNGVKFSGGISRGSGTRDPGFVSIMGTEFEHNFAAGHTLHIYLDDQKIDQLSLAGTSAALASVNRCLAGLRMRLAAEQRERERWAHLPKDPFARPTTAAGSGCMPPTSAASSQDEVGGYRGGDGHSQPSSKSESNVSTTNSDISGPLRAAQAAKQAPPSPADEQMRHLFAGWQALERGDCRK